MKKLTWRSLAVRSTAVAAMALSYSAWAGVPSFTQAPAIVGDSNFCLGKDDGSYSHPDCRVRYSCSRGAATQVNCPDGQVFDAHKNGDDDPALSYCSVPEKASRVDCSGLALKN